MSKRGRGSRRVDGRLWEQVYDYYVATQMSGIPVTVSDVVANLCSVYPEYKRKPQAVLKRTVADALSKIKQKVLTEDSDDDDDNGDVDGDFVVDRKPTLASLGRNKSGSGVIATSASASPVNAQARKKVKRMKASDGSGSGTGGKRRSGNRGSDTGGAHDGPEATVAHKPHVPTARYADFGGIEACLQDVREVIEYPMRHPEIFVHLGVDPPRGVLLEGPPGCGKSMLASAVAGELNVPLLRISAPEVVSGMSGQSEKRIRDLFAEAIACAPSLIFIDEIDAITPKRDEAQRGMERRMVAQLLTCMDQLTLEQCKGKLVMVIGATNRPHALDPALRRAGRFDREIRLGVPDTAARARILAVVCRSMRLEGEFDYQRLAARTPGYVGADLAALAKEAAVIAVNRIFDSLADESPIAVVDLTDDCGGGGDGVSGIDANGQADGGANTGGDATDGDVSEQGGRNVNAQTGEADVNGGGGSGGGGGGGDGGGDSHAMEEGDDGDGIDDGVDDDGKDVAMQGVSSDAQAGQGTPGDHDAPEADDGASAAVVVAGAAARALAKREAIGQQLQRLGTLTAAQLEPLAICMADFEAALHKVQPSAQREGFATIPDVAWSDVGALTEVREELSMAILAPIQRPDDFDAVGLSAPSGVLLYGPPGCGKTLLAKAIANEAGANFISIKGPELLNKYVGESERAVRLVFERARASAPCIVFFDEMDALAPKRSGESQVSERVVNQLLTELDGLDARKSVYVIGATNRPDIIDPAMLRPGRLDKLLYVPLPSADERVQILRTLTRQRPRLAADVDLEAVGRDARCRGFSGADLASLVREASLAALSQHFAQERAGGPSAPGPGLRVAGPHFELAFAKVSPSVSAKDQRVYARLQHRLRRKLLHIEEGGSGGEGTPTVSRIDGNQQPRGRGGEDPPPMLTE